MLQEAIYKFKASGPMLLPELIDNYWIGEIKAYEDYAILPYEVHIPQPIDKVIDMFEMNADLAILYHLDHHAYRRSLSEACEFTFLDGIYQEGIRTPLPSLYMSEERCIGSLINHISITLQTGHESCLRKVPQMKPEKKMPQSTIKEWEEIGVPEDWAYVLRKAGFNLISDIREEKAQGLQQKIGEINKKYKLGYEKPSVDDIQGWIDRSNVEC